MPMKLILVCVNKDIVPSISYSMKEFEGKVTLKYVPKISLLKEAVLREDSLGALILDANVDQISTTDIAKEIKAERPNTRILFIASSDTSKDELIQCIQSKLFAAVLVRPFTAEKLTDSIYTICGIEKPKSMWFESKTVKK
jgi:DNA-binding NtrC family response regulator